MISDCCREPIDLVTTIDGSNPMRCRMCKKPCKGKSMNKPKEEKECEHIPAIYDVSFLECRNCKKDLVYLTEEEFSNLIPRSKLLEILDKFPTFEHQGCEAILKEDLREKIKNLST